MRKNLKVEQLGDLLERPILAVLATRRKDGSILTSPVWHEWDDGGFSITTWANDIKSKNIKRDPSITILVAESDLPYRGLEVSGQASIEVVSDPMPMIIRLACRYMGEQEGTAYAETFRDVPQELIRLKPGRIRAWDFNDSH